MSINSKRYINLYSFRIVLRIKLKSRKLLSIIFLSRENTLNRLLELSNEIFRIKTDDYTFPLFSSLHFKIILCVVITIFIAIIFKEKIKKWKYRRAFEITTALILISTQIFLAIWYSRFPNFYLKESLPLYPCRIAIIMAAIGLIWKKNDFAKSIAPIVPQK